MKTNSAPLLLATVLLALPGCSQPTAPSPAANRASPAPSPGPGIDLMRNRTLLLAKRTVWSGRVHKSRFHGALPAGSQVITDQRSWLRFWRTLHDDTPAPQINFGEDFVHIAAHDSNDPNPPTPNLAIYNPPGELRVEQVFRAIYYPPTPPAKTLTVKITLYSRDGIRKFPAENLQPGPP